MALSSARLIPTPGGFALNADASLGLVIRVHGGFVTASGPAWQSAPGVMLTLADNATNYVDVGPAGDIAANVTGFGGVSRSPLYEIVTASGAVTSLQDCRSRASTGITTLIDAATVVWDVTGASRDLATLTIAGARALSIVGAAAGFVGVLLITESGALRSLSLPATSIVSAGGNGAIALSGSDGGFQKWTVTYDGARYSWEAAGGYT